MTSSCLPLSSSSSSSSSTLQSLKYKRGSLEILDQLLVPHQHVYIPIHNVSDGVDVIRSMQVRGAPLIAIVGCLSIAVELENHPKDNIDKFLIQSVDLLINARPTAVNMKTEGTRLLEFTKRYLASESEGSKGVDIVKYKIRVIEYLESLMADDIETNKNIGRWGGEAIRARASRSKPLNILTHCNTGSLATCGYGTALGVIRTLHETKELSHVYFTETRPYNQGSRLTSFELLYEKIPCTLVCDSAVSWLMKTKGISAVVVGADRVARNGDTANKIGTYQLALIARAHFVPFFIAAPFTTVDPKILSGNMIQIEERPGHEVTTIGGKRISPEGVSVWNPAFDVTPADLITGIITEKGVFTPGDLGLEFPPIDDNDK